MKAFKRKKIMEHLIGPTGSVILHILIVIALVKFVVFDTKETESEIEVAMKEIETVDIEEILDEIKPEIDPVEFDVQIDAPDVDVDVPPQETEDFSQQEPDVDFAALNVMNVDSPLTLAGLYSGRSAAGRSARLRQYGGRWGEKTERSVIMALEWLKKNQLADGSWAHGGPSTAMTGLGLMTFLAHGETVSSPDYGETVRKAIEYLISQQQPDGNFKNTGGHHVYGNAIGAYALSEAFAMTRIPAVKDAMDKAARVLVEGQQAGGGWDYDYKKGARRDTSVVGWQVQALKAASMAGSDVPGIKEALNRSLVDLASVQDATTGHFGYTGPGRNLSMTGIGLLCYQLLGKGNTPVAQAAAVAMKEASCDWGNSGPWAMYRWYYYTQVMFQQGGSVWTAWNNQFAPQYVNNQNKNGSWTSPSGIERGGGGTEINNGPVYSTTFAALALQVYYRLLPTFAVQPEKIEEVKPTDDVVIEII